VVFRRLVLLLNGPEFTFLAGAGFRIPFVFGRLDLSLLLLLLLRSILQELREPVDSRKKATSSNRGFVRGRSRG